MTTSLRIDDRDPSIVYSPGLWRAEGSVNEFNGTTMGTMASGATSQLQFTGTSIAVFGTIPGSNSKFHGNPHSTYSLDGQLVHQFAPSREDDTQYNVTFYQSDTLPLGNHTLLVTSLGGKLTFYLDYFEVNGDSSTTGLPISTSLLSTPTTTLSPTPAAASSPAISTNSSSIPNGSLSKKTSIGPIVGGILGGLALLATISICLMMAVCRRRRRHQPHYSVDFLRQMGQRTNLESLEVNSHNQVFQCRSQFRPGFHGTVEPFYLAMSQSGGPLVQIESRQSYHKPELLANMALEADQTVESTHINQRSRSIHSSTSTSPPPSYYTSHQSAVLERYTEKMVSV